MKRKILLIVILIIMIGVGGKWYMEHQAKKEQADLLAVEKQSVKVLKQTFADIAEVKIEQSAKNKMTGSYRMLVTMINTKGQSVYFDYGFWKESNEIGSYGVENREVQKKELQLIK
jgi:hypothetical protein